MQTNRNHLITYFNIVILQSKCSWRGTHSPVGLHLKTTKVRVIVIEQEHCSYGNFAAQTMGEPQVYRGHLHMCVRGAGSHSRSPNPRLVCIKQYTSPLNQEASFVSGELHP